MMVLMLDALFFLLFGLFATGSWGDLLTSSFDIDKVMMVVIFSGLTVALAYPLVGKLVLRRRFRWAAEGARAFSIGMWTVVPGIVFIEIQTIVANLHDLGRVVAYSLPAVYGTSEVHWPAWCSIVANVLLLAFVVAFAIVAWRLASRARRKADAASVS